MSNIYITNSDAYKDSGKTPEEIEKAIEDAIEENEKFLEQFRICKLCDGRGYLPDDKSGKLLCSCERDKRNR